MFINRYLLLPLLGLFLLQAASAQQTVPMPASIVLVLKLVSNTHVKPVTGIVISDDGLILVPAEFVSTEGEIVVLDGGTDIAGHGRPATVVNPSINGGLALISVEGLDLPGITLAKSSQASASDFHLSAFPPAKYIAKGASPFGCP